MALVAVRTSLGPYADAVSPHLIRNLGPRLAAGPRHHDDAESRFAESAAVDRQLPVAAFGEGGRPPVSLVVHLGVARTFEFDRGGHCEPEALEDDQAHGQDEGGDCGNHESHPRPSP